MKIEIIAKYLSTLTDRDTGEKLLTQKQINKTSVCINKLLIEPLEQEIVRLKKENEKND